MYPVLLAPASSTIYIPFATYSGSTGASATMTNFAVTDIEIYKNGSTTQRSSDNGVTLLDTDGTDFDTVTGLHGFSIDLSDNTDAGFYAAGSWYWVVVSVVTVDAQTVTFIAAMFRIVAAEGTVGTPKVDVSLLAGSAIDQTGGLINANVKQISTDATAADNAESFFDGTGYAGTGNTIPTVTTTGTATAVTTVNGLAASVITAASIAADAITAAKIADGAIDAATFAAGAINAAAIAADAITDAKVAADVTIASVTGAVGSVTGAVGSVAAGGIAAASFAAGAIDAAAIAANAIGASELADNAITAAKIATGAIDADALAADAVDEIWDEQIGDSTITARQAMKILVAALGGKLSGAATTTVTIRNAADTSNVIVATVDADGNRSAVTLTV